MIIKIPGTPIAKKRPRFARRGKFVKTYNDQQTEEGKTLAIIMQQCKEKHTKDALKVAFYFRMPRPKSHFGTGRNAGKIKPSAPVYHTKKPDIDNLVKFYMDVLNGFAWVDDSQVVIVEASKIYSDEPGTTIVINDLLQYGGGNAK